MSQIQDHAVCIRQQSYSETSQILTFFSREHGKVRTIAKGARREKGRFGGGVDLLAMGTIGFHPPRGESSLAVLSEFELINGFGHLRKQLIAQNCGLYAACFIAELTEDLDPHDDLFHAFQEALNRWDEGDRPLAVLVRFELILLEEIGLLPSWDRCGQCGKPISAARGITFDSRLAGAVCPSCSSALTQKVLLSPEVLDVFQNPRRMSQANPSVLRSAHELLGLYECELIHKQPTILKFLNQLLRNQK